MYWSHAPFLSICNHIHCQTKYIWTYIANNYSYARKWIYINQVHNNIEEDPEIGHGKKIVGFLFFSIVVCLHTFASFNSLFAEITVWKGIFGVNILLKNHIVCTIIPRLIISVSKYFSSMALKCGQNLLGELYQTSGMYFWPVYNHATPGKLHCVALHFLFPTQISSQTIRY